MSVEFAKGTGAEVPIFALSKGDTLPDEIGAAGKAWAEASGFQGKAGEVCKIADANGALRAVLAGLGDQQSRKRARFVFGGIRGALPKGQYALRCNLAPIELNEAVLGWLLAGYTFDRYAAKPASQAMLVPPSEIDTDRCLLIAQSECLTRDLINTPANDLGPDELEVAVLKLATEFNAKTSVIRGDDLLEQNFPMVHAVGRAAEQAPRLIELTWGTTGPKLTLVGKGVCFDTGGLNLKPGASMGLMKKDMGGAANVLGLARMIMGSRMKVQLRVLVPAVENSVARNAFRPGDILPSRKGLSVEINNTDAEGRLVLGDALSLADEGSPDLIISMATLTGAARVAVGPDLAPFYANDDGDASVLEYAAKTTFDPVWRMPFWDPYESMIEPGIADLDNAPKGGFAGSITAALFLRRFVTNTNRYMHFDIYGWNPAAAPARPKGGAAQGIRALFEALPKMLDI